MAHIPSLSGPVPRKLSNILKCVIVDVHEERSASIKW